MKFLTASMRHHLLPLHHRLRREGHDCEALVWRSRYETAWEGSVSKLVRHSDGTLSADALAPTREAAERGEVVVLTDVRRVAELFAAAPRLFGPLPPEAGTTVPPADRLMFGGWFTGEEIQAPHLLVADWGVWTGGLGTPVLGGLTLVRLGNQLTEVGRGTANAVVGGAAHRVTELLKRAGFRGLFHFDVEETADTGELLLRGLAAGWPWLHTQAFAAELDSLSGALTGATPHLSRRFVTVLPVSVPPWPNEKSGGMPNLPVEGLTPQQQGQLYWFDIRLAPDRRALLTAGLDGLLAVATGASDSTPALARARALTLADRIRVPGKQFRQDVGLQVDGVLATLEERWGLSVL